MKKIIDYEVSCRGFDPQELNRKASETEKTLALRALRSSYWHEKLQRIDTVECLLVLTKDLSNIIIFLAQLTEEFLT